MTLQLNKILKSFFCALVIFGAYSHSYAVENDSEQATDNFEIRVNPDIEFGNIDFTPQKIEYPTFIKKENNHIEFNGANWSGLFNEFCGLNKFSIYNRIINIVHIGDSHIQADFATAQTRMDLQKQFGNAGLGIISPLRLAKTNQPYSYSITSNSNFAHSTLMRKPWEVDMGFTGVALKPLSSKFNINIEVNTNYTNGSKFDFVKIYHSGDLIVDKITSHGKIVENNSFADTNGTGIPLDQETTSISLELSHNDEAPSIYGFELNRNQNGVIYSAIGNNGATYQSYSEIPGFYNSIASITPQLIIVSLGANEAFGSISSSEFYGTIDTFVKGIKKYLPDTPILLVTPIECQRSYKSYYYRKVKGKKRRYSTTKYKVNTKIASLREEILRYGKNNSVAVWDLYKIAGGAGASNIWINNNLYGSDRIHFKASGYKLQGELLYDALIKEINKNKCE